MKGQDVKRSSERALKKLGVLVNPGLPLIEKPSQLKPRSAEEVAARAWVLSHIIYLAYGSRSAAIAKLLKKARLEEYVTPNEERFLKRRRLNQLDKNWAGWLAEALHGCAWALGVVETGPLDDCP